jgi:hypothetical protein
MVALVFAASALAVSGTPIDVGTPLASGPPSVAVDATGTAYVAWANTKDLPPASGDTLQYCVIPAGAVGCSHAGTLVPADGASHIDGAQVLVDGSTVVLLADVFGAQGATAEEFEPEQEWTSTDGGATFTNVDGGKSVTSAVVNADTEPLSAVIVPGTGVLGYGWNTAGQSPPTFNAFPLSSPPECSVKSCPAGFAKLAPATQPDQIGNAGGQFASQQGASPGVLAVFNTDFTSGNVGCSNASTVPFGTAYAYASGDQSPSNDYNVSPGEPNSAWKVAITQLDCNVDTPAVAGGPSGFGVVENDDLTDSTIYHRFDQSTLAFDTPAVTIANEGSQDPAVNQDGAGGVYVTYRAGAGGPIRVAYSYNGGTTWVESTLNPNTDNGADNVTSAVDAAGQGWATWTDNGSVFVQRFVAADAVPPPAATTLTTRQSSGTIGGASISIPAGTVGETDQATIAGASAATASGTVTYALYSQSSCAASSKVFDGGTQTVSAGVPGHSNAVTAALVPGRYYWQAGYSGNASTLITGAGNAPSTSACGSEVLTVSSPVVISAHARIHQHKHVSVTVRCKKAPCTITIKILVKGKKGLVLARGTFKLKKTSLKELKIDLTDKGKSFLKSHHGKFSATISVSDKIGGHTVVTTKLEKLKA